MNKLRLFILFFMLSVCGHAQDPAARKYAEKYGEMAVAEMRKFGIPASITLAQAIIESGAGKARLARHANNHFGVKAGNTWNGERLGKYRKYESVEDAYDDRSYFLTKRKQY